MKIVTQISKPDDIAKVTAQLLTLLQTIQEGKVYECEIKEFQKRRSLDANSYAWVLCDKIAEKLKSTKEQVYRKMIKEVGVFTTVCSQKNAVADLLKGWEKHGIGWIAENVGASKINGCDNVMLYYGSSTYDTKEMSRLIDELITVAQGLGIETKTPDEIAQMMSLWEKK